MTNTKKRVFTGILLTIFLFIITLGFFAYTFPKKEQGIAKADNVFSSYSFVSSDMYHLDVYYQTWDAYYSYPCLFSANFSFDESNPSFVTVSPHFNGCTIQGLNVIYNEYHNFTHDSGSSYVTSFNLLRNNTVQYCIFANNYTDVQNGSYFLSYYKCSPDFNCNVYKIVLEVKNSDFDGSVLSGVKALYISYYDVNDNVLMIQFRVAPNLIFSTRSYYLVSADNLTENQSYNAGYQQGLTDNQQNVYNDGYSAGRITGYNTGYSAGVANANNYSFISLMGAVIDAPVNAFNSLFNFTVLGVNLRTFILGLLSFAVLLTIWKWIKGGR